jgi:AraC-like DNA-binding protein
MLCGAFQLCDPKLNLMDALLPPLLHIRSTGDQASVQLRALTRCIETELEVSRPGEQAIVTRMAEAFLLRAIRDHVLSSSNGDHGLPAVLRDPSIARVLGLIHQRPEHAWTVDALANEANLSRSGFAARFKMRVGATPQSYLQRYRFSKAVQLLQTDAKIYEIAQRVGYDSESSFSKAFKRLMGKSPGAYRLPK